MRKILFSLLSRRPRGSPFPRRKGNNVCGERIPVENSFVAKRLMDIIRQQMRMNDLPSLRNEARRYFPTIEYILRKCNMPDDLKYIPIVESGFTNATSKAGARGFWQLMPNTAREWGLVVQGDGSVDQRDDPYRSTIAAMRELARTFLAIRRDHSVSSWVLTAAAYNYGIGRLYDKMKAQGNNYFTMQLNPETALYVYKLIAVKELFEYPELYMRNFRYNVFNPQASAQPVTAVAGDTAAFRKMSFTAKKDYTVTPDDALISKTKAPTQKELEASKKEAAVKPAKLVRAIVVGKYPDFKDGDSLVIRLVDDLQALNTFRREGAEIKGKGWIIDDRVFVDLGFDTNNVILYDAKSEQGIPLSNLKNKSQVVLRVQN